MANLPAIADHSIAISTAVASFDMQQIALIKKQIAPGIPDGELQLFGMVCQRTGLDPFAKQIYTIKRGDKWTILTGIDGYRLIAVRSNALAGIDDAEYDTEDADQPMWARVTVWRMVGGIRCPFTAKARWSEYSVANNPQWRKMPYLMLAKCAEALALRKAFPAELSGIYTQSEMDQADNMPPSHTIVEQPEKTYKSASFRAHLNQLGYTTIDTQDDLIGAAGVAIKDTYTASETQQILDYHQSRHTAA